MFDYNEKKKELLMRKKQILKDYSILFQDTINFYQDTMNVFDSSDYSSPDKIEWLLLNLTDEDMKKILRLIMSLHYVESPRDEIVLKNLQDNIANNNDELKFKPR